MKILDRYLLRNFWSTLAYIVLTCYCLLLILELFENFGDMLEHQTPWWRAAQYVWCAMPYKLLEVLPLTIMLAVLFSVGMLAHNSEILAMTAAGVSIYRVAAPLIVSALLISILMIAANETVVFSWQEKARRLERRWIDNRPEKERRRKIRVRGENNRLYLIGEYEITPRVMHWVQIFDRDSDNNRVRSQLVAESARWLRHDAQAKRDVWEFINAVQREFNDAGDLISYRELGENIPATNAGGDATNQVNSAETGVADIATTDAVAVTLEAAASLTTRTVELGLEPGLVKALAVRKKPEEMNAFELYDYIQQREAMNKSTADFRGQLYLRLLFPFSCTVMMLIGFPFALKAQRGRTMVAGFGLGILCAIAFYALTAFLSAFVEQELIPPWAAASLPLAAFSIFGLILLRRSSIGQ